MQVQPRLLDHPFYRAWERGEVPAGTLAAYHRSYARLIERVPSYWQRVVKAFQPHLPSDPTVVQEERDHVRLWELWGSRLDGAAEAPAMEPLLSALDAMTPSQLLGALQAFELQQPEVARTKKEGLLRHYGFTERELVYFEEHQKEEGHIAYGRMLADRFADPGEFASGFAGGARLLYHSLDAFAEAAGCAAVSRP